MKCKYEGTGIYEGRCYGTKEIDPCPGYDKCSQFKPNFITNGDHIRSMNNEGLAAIFCYFLISTLRASGINAALGEHFQESFAEWLAEPYKEKEE